MSSLSNENSSFWNELCGSQLARLIGVHDDSPESLSRYDSWYFNFYPYLRPMIEKLEPAGKSVFEVGLGYGSGSQLLAQLGGNVTCLDIAEGPVAMANHRFNHLGLPGVAQVGDILAEPVEHEVYDVVVSIGALHHTGNLAKSISNIKKMLRPGGKGLIMVYNAYSFRRWQSTPGETMNYLRREIMGYRR